MSQHPQEFDLKGTKGKIMSQRRHGGFTILELIVTTAVTAILAAMILSGLGIAREHGRRAQCLSNMRQLANAIIMYGADNQSMPTPYLYEKQYLGDGQFKMVVSKSWNIANIGPGATESILLCPSDKTPSKMNTTDPVGQPVTIASSYSYNFLPFITDTRTMMLRSPRTVLLFDGKPDAAFAGTWWGVSDGTAGPNGKVTICHQGNQMSVNEDAIGHDPGGHAPGPPNHPDCRLGLCQGSEAYNLSRYNNVSEQQLVRRHLKKANIIFLDGHGEIGTVLPNGSLLPQ
jgi:prepilin-type N-terminal cleavage/methylation domain-containing protein/prepilin-type processing-associated H-X9-DG protein